MKRFAFKALNCILCGSDEEMQLLLDGNKVSYFSTFLNHQDRIVQNIAICFLSKVIKCSSKNKEAFINSGVLPKIIDTVSQNDLKTNKFVVELIASLSSRASSEIIKQIVAAGAIPHLCVLMQDTKMAKVSG